MATGEGEVCPPLLLLRRLELMAVFVWRPVFVETVWRWCSTASFALRVVSVVLAVYAR